MVKKRKKPECLYVLYYYDPMDFNENELAIELRDERRIIDGWNTKFQEDEPLTLIMADGTEYVLDEIILTIEEDDYGVVITTDEAIWDFANCDNLGVPYLIKRKLFKSRRK